MTTYTPPRSVGEARLRRGRNPAAPYAFANLIGTTDGHTYRATRVEAPEAPRLMGTALGLVLRDTLNGDTATFAQHLHPHGLWRFLNPNVPVPAEASPAWEQGYRPSGAGLTPERVSYGQWLNGDVAVPGFGIARAPLGIDLVTGTLPAPDQATQSTLGRTVGDWAFLVGDHSVTILYLRRTTGLRVADVPIRDLADLDRRRWTEIVCGSDFSRCPHAAPVHFPNAPAIYRRRANTAQRWARVIAEARGRERRG